MAERADLNLDLVLGIHARVISYVFQTLVEQGVSLLDKLLTDLGKELSQVVVDYPTHLRFGVPTAAARVLAGGVKHRRAAVALGRCPELLDIAPDDHLEIFQAAHELLQDEPRWRTVLGSLVLANTRADTAPSVDNED